MVLKWRQKNTSAEKWRRGEGGWRESSERESAGLAQWVLLVSQWQCQGSWQGPDARHQLQRLLNRLLSRRHICTAILTHTHTHNTCTHRHVGTCIYYSRHIDWHWLIVSLKSCKGDSERLCALCHIQTRYMHAQNQHCSGFSLFFDDVLLLLFVLCWFYHCDILVLLVL